MFHSLIKCHIISVKAPLYVRTLHVLLNSLRVYVCNAHQLNKMNFTKVEFCQIFIYHIFHSQVEMENVTTKEKYTFKCGRWLAVDEDDHSTVREMPAEGPLVKKPLACKFYIHTAIQINISHALFQICKIEYDDLFEMMNETLVCDSKLAACKGCLNS